MGFFFESVEPWKLIWKKTSHDTGPAYYWSHESVMSKNPSEKGFFKRGILKCKSVFCVQFWVEIASPISNSDKLCAQRLSLDAKRQKDS